MLRHLAACISKRGLPGYYKHTAPAELAAVTPALPTNIALLRSSDRRSPLYSDRSDGSNGVRRAAIVAATDASSPLTNTINNNTNESAGT